MTAQTVTRTEAKAQIADLAVRIRVTPVRTVLTFRTLFQAEQAAALFLAAGITCCWSGGNRPVLHTAADFTEKGGE